MVFVIAASDRLGPGVARFAEAVERFCAAPIRASGPELSFDMREESRCRDLIELNFSEMAAAFAATDEYDLDGSAHRVRTACRRDAPIEEREGIQRRQVPHVSGPTSGTPGAGQRLSMAWLRPARLLYLRPPSVHWVKGGPTNLDSLALLCRRHHWLLHESKWQLIKTDDGEMIVVPPQLDLFERLTSGRAQLHNSVWRANGDGAGAGSELTHHAGERALGAHFNESVAAHLDERRDTRGPPHR